MGTKEMEPHLRGGGPRRILWPIQDKRQSLVPVCRKMAFIRRQVFYDLAVFALRLYSYAGDAWDAGRRYRKLALIWRQFSVLLHALPTCPPALERLHILCQILWTLLEWAWCFSPAECGPGPFGKLDCDDPGTRLWK